MAVEDGAHSPIDGRARQLEHRWLGSDDQLDTERTQWSSEIALITHGEVRDDRAVTAQAASDADGWFVTHNLGVDAM